MILRLHFIEGGALKLVNCILICIFLSYTFLKYIYVMSYNVNILSGLSAFTINTFLHNEVKSFLKQQFYYSIQSQVPCKLKETQAHENKSSKSDHFVILAIFYQKNETLADSLDLWWIFLISNLHIMYLFRNGGFSKKMADSTESARGIGHFKITTFSCLSGMQK